MDVERCHRGFVQRTRGIVAGAVLVVLGLFARSQAAPEAALRLRVIAALARERVWIVGTEIRVVGSDVRVQGFVRSKADRGEVLWAVAAVRGVARVRDALALTGWPAEPGAGGASPVVLAAANAP